MKKLLITLFTVIGLFALSASYAGPNVDVGYSPDLTFNAISDTGLTVTTDATDKLKPDIVGGNSNVYSKASEDIGAEGWRMSPCMAGCDELSFSINGWIVSGVARQPVPV